MRTKAIFLTILSLLGFAGNSLLCRLALKHTGIDAASFTSIRLVSGAVMLWLIVRVRAGVSGNHGNWWSALALFAYAAAFSFAYLNLTAATGALLLFGAVQCTMIGFGIWKGEKLGFQKMTGMVLAVIGLVVLLLPGLSSPPPGSSLLMLAAGISWGIYTLRGKQAGDPLLVTAGNFLRAAPMALILSLVAWKAVSPDPAGVGYALASGAVTSGIVYAIWYTVLPHFKSSTAATLQLSVPVLAALGGILFLHEPVTLRLLASSVLVLGGIALVVLHRQGS